MTAALPYTRIFAGPVEATAMFSGQQGWPMLFTSTSGTIIIYDDRIFYDSAVAYDGLVIPVDVTVTVSTTQLRWYPAGATRRHPEIGATRVATLQVRPIRLRPQSGPTRVTRLTWLAVQRTRVAREVGRTRKSASVGPTRVQRGK
jgi:hypothetical protein